MTDAFVPPGRPFHGFGGSDRQASRRSELRVAGPFDGRRVGTRLEMGRQAGREVAGRCVF